MLSDRFRSYSKNRKISRNNYSLSLVVTRCITRLSFYKRSIESALTEVYSKTDFSRNSYYEETSNFICIANHLTGFRIIQVSSEKNFRSELWLQNILTCNKQILGKLFVKIHIFNYYVIRRSSYFLCESSFSFLITQPTISRNYNVIIT